MKQHGSLHVYCSVVIEKRRSFLQSAAKLGLHYFLYSKHTGQPKGQNGVRLDEHGVRLEWEGWVIGGTLLLFATLAYHSHLSSCTSCSLLHIFRSCFRNLPVHFFLNIMHDSGGFLFLGPFPKCTVPCIISSLSPQKIKFSCS